MKNLAVLVKSPLVVVAMLLAGTGATHAGPDSAAYAPPALFARPPALPPGYDDATALRLDLMGALQIAIAQNIGLATERRKVDAAEVAAASAPGILYEPTLSANYGHTQGIDPPPTLQAGSAGDLVTQTSDSWSFGATERLPTGASLTLATSFGRYASTSGAATLPLGYSSMLSLSLDQPLFRGFSRDLAIPQMQILQAKISSASERLALQAAAITVVQQTESAYWDVVSAMYGYRVAVDSEHDADETLALAHRQVEAGMLPASQLSGAESTVASRQVAVLRAAAGVEQSWDGLRTVLNLPRDQWSRPIVPIDLPRFDATPPPSVDAAIEVALAHRVEFAKSKLDRASTDLAIRQAENNRLPQIDLQLGANLQSLDSTADGALTGLAEAIAPTWNVGFAIQWTPMHRASDAALAGARLQRDLQLASQDLAAQQLWSEVRAVVRARSNSALEVATAAHARELATAALAIENRNYVAGTTTTTAVAQKQQEVATDELAELQALVGNAHAETALLVATGQLLEARHVELVAK